MKTISNIFGYLCLVVALVIFFHIVYEYRTADEFEFDIYMGFLVIVFLQFHNTLTRK